MKKILLTNYYYKPHFGGIENSLFHISQVIRDNGDEPILVVSDADLTKKNRLPSEDVIDEMKIYRFKRFLPSLKLFILLAPFIDIYRAGKLIKKLNRQYNFPLSINRNHLTGLGCINSGIKLNYYIIPAILMVSDRYNENSFLSLNLKNKLLIFYNNNILLKTHSYFQKKFANACTHVLTLSQNMKKQVMQFLDVPEHKITVHFPGVSIPKYQPDILPKNGKFRFVIVGRITGVKRIDLAIQAIKILNNKSCELNIVGDGPLKQDLQNLVAKLELTENVFFYSFTSDVGSYYYNSDCFIMSSEYEAFGQTNLEAMSFGLPIIAFRADGKKVKTASNEIIEDGINGLLIDVMSPEALAQGMNKIMNEPKQIEYYRRNNLSKSKQYTWANFLDTILKLHE